MLQLDVTEIKHISFALGNQEVNLTVEQAEKLFNLLEKFFSKKEEVRIVEKLVIQERPYWYWQFPQFHYSSEKVQNPPMYEITCSMDGTAKLNF